MKVVSKAYTGLVLQQSHLESHPSPHDVKNFFALLDKAIRHPGFSVEHKKVLFSWKNDCQRVMAKWNPQMYVWFVCPPCELKYDIAEHHQRSA